MVFSTAMNPDQPKYRVNGSQLANFQGKGVCVIGKASNVTQAGTSFTLTASDGQNIQVILSNPVDDYVEGIMEVQGVVDSPNSLQCAHYVKFSPDSVNKFDMETYDKALQLIHKSPEHYMQGVSQAS